MVISLYPAGPVSTCNPVTELQLMVNLCSDGRHHRLGSSPLHLSLPTLSAFPLPLPSSYTCQGSFPVADESHGKREGSGSGGEVGRTVKSLARRRINVGQIQDKNNVLACLRNCT